MITTFGGFTSGKALIALQKNNPKHPTFAPTSTLLSSLPKRKNHSQSPKKRKESKALLPSENFDDDLVEFLNADVVFSSSPYSPSESNNSSDEDEDVNLLLGKIKKKKEPKNPKTSKTSKSKSLKQLPGQSLLQSFLKVSQNSQSSQRTQSSQEQKEQLFSQFDPSTHEKVIFDVPSIKNQVLIEEKSKMNFQMKKQEYQDIKNEKKLILEKMDEEFENVEYFDEHDEVENLFEAEKKIEEMTKEMEREIEKEIEKEMKIEKKRKMEIEMEVQMEMEMEIELEKEKEIVNEGDYNEKVIKEEKEIFKKKSDVALDLNKSSSSNLDEIETKELEKEKIEEKISANSTSLISLLTTKEEKLELSNQHIEVNNEKEQCLESILQNFDSQPIFSDTNGNVIHKKERKKLSLSLSKSKQEKPITPSRSLDSFNNSIESPPPPISSIQENNPTSTLINSPLENHKNINLGHYQETLAEENSTALTDLEIEKVLEPQNSPLKITKGSKGKGKEKEKEKEITQKSSKKISKENSNKISAGQIQNDQRKTRKSKNEKPKLEPNQMTLSWDKAKILEPKN